jgi:hypothetical protein
VTYLPICQHRSTSFVRLQGCAHITRCACGVEFAMLPPEGPHERTVQRRKAKLRASEERLARARQRMFGR